MGYGVLVHTWVEEMLAASRAPRLNLLPPPTTMTTTTTTMIAATRIVEFEVDTKGRLGGRVRAVRMVSPMHTRLKQQRIKRNAVVFSELGVARLAAEINSTKFKGRESKAVITEERCIGSNKCVCGPLCLPH